MEPLPVSVVVVSRERPLALARCLTGLAQLDYPSFEVVVVTCPAGIEAVNAHTMGEHVKAVAFDRANIAQARNHGIAEAAGELVALIDDDAVPEPLWLQHLIAPFADSEVAATGGYVIGRNGISIQWQARSVDQTGEATDLEMQGNDPAILHGTAEKAIKTEGTNMAVRRALLADMGGFDPAYHFYLDETDLNMRLARAGLATAIVPLAQIHHGFEASARRAADRTPRDLTQIGASKAVFLRKYCPPKQSKKAWRRFRKEQRARLVRVMQRGPLGADDVWRLMRGLERGRKEGLARQESDATPIPSTSDEFRPFPGRPDAKRVELSGRIWQRAELREQAAEAAQSGAIVSLYLMSRTTLYHRVRFDPRGFWEQTGGIFGRSTRDGTAFQFWRLKTRVKHEITRIAAVRGRSND